MKLWIVFVLLTIICWGAYVPALHGGQRALGKDSALRAFLFVGVAYCVVSVVVLGYVILAKAEPMQFTGRGMTLSTLAGVLGAVGALGVVFALNDPAGHPLVVAPLIFAGAPIVNTIVSMVWHKPGNPPGLLFYAGIALAAVGASMVLRFKPV